MKDTDLKKKYPGIWESVESNVMDDLRRYFCDSPKPGDVVDHPGQIIAHNAAFIACHEHHKAIRLRK
jgi:hypothetical protein